MRRPQFTIRSLLVAMLVVAAFFGGMSWQRSLDQRKRNTSTFPYATFNGKEVTTPTIPSKTFSLTIGFAR